MKKSMSEIPEHERPREKLLAKGAQALSDQELIAVLLGKGTHEMDVMTLAGKIRRIVDEKGLDLKPADLMGFKGVGEAKAVLIMAAIEFVRRRIKPDGVKIGAPADVLPLIRHYAARKQEYLLSVSINGANEVINIRVVSIGLIDRSHAHPREVFADVLSDRASGIIIAHNHPAGNLEPSHADTQITQQLKQAGDIIGIPLLDHIIFNGNAYYSFLEEGLLQSKD
jgi:DNA repair protein RadC